MAHVRPGRTAKTARQIAAKKRLEDQKVKEKITEPEEADE